MEIVINPPRITWGELLKRPALPKPALFETVKNIMDDVAENGNTAIRKYSLKFDLYDTDDFEVTKTEMDAAVQQLSDELRTAIDIAAKNIRIFHSSQLQDPQKIETMPGVSCWRKNVGIEKVGIYIPGGTAPLFSTVLMLAIPAQLAGCTQVILCSPPDAKGKLHPAILYAATLAGVTKIFKIGGVQAIAAMTFGTQTVPKVYKIFGPGNQYVTAAKQIAQQQNTAIDMPAGPSEVCVIADEMANSSFVAADLLSQAEHGADSQVVLLTTSLSFANKVQKAIIEQLLQLPRKALAEQALANSKFIVLNSVDDCLTLANEYAAEHLILHCANAATMAEKVINAGSVFIGSYTPESVGDYASGTNHTLPTNGFAKAYSGVSIDSFVKKITFQQISDSGLAAIAPTVITLAEAEGLQAHAVAVKIRLSKKL
jgi:histidinol dehydrogenase